MISREGNLAEEDNDKTDVVAQSQDSTRARSGRSGPRSRTGCAVCKQRRVRCDEKKPQCTHCTRLQLDCLYQSRPRKRQIFGGVGGTTNFSTQRDNLQGTANPSQVFNSQQACVAGSWPSDLAAFPFLDNGLYGAGGADFATFDAPNAENSFGTFMFADTPWHSPPAETSGANVPRGANCEASFLAHDLGESVFPGRRRPERPSNAIDRSNSHFVLPRNVAVDRDRSQYLLSYFQQIVQPPAAILVSGVRKWRRLQRYLMRLAEQHQVVASALNALLELLVLDENTQQPDLNGKRSMSDALSWHSAARDEIAQQMSRHQDVNQKDQLLASIFLLAWFEVIRDQVSDQSLFPRELADRIITEDANWNQYSKQLLQWLNTLDSKATHVGGQHLLSSRALQVVAQHPTQISTTDGTDDEQSDNESPEALSGSVVSSPVHTISGRFGPSPRDAVNRPRLGQMKQILLNTVLQPALEWYQAGQSYCRRISSQDRHHRNRFTVKDEYEVITACKQLEADLSRLWRQRPKVITLMASQLSEIVCTDVAVRLEEIFCIYLASFWILFVYLHRVSWWSLPHSETAQGALEEAWKNMQRSYGEVVNAGQKKVVHPALLWPLFLFGMECPNEARRQWAIDQLEALGVAKPVVGDDDAGDMLPAFRLSAGATRNAKRAALLLRELIKRQDQQRQRVDEKDLSVEMFGCHFSII